MRLFVVVLGLLASQWSAPRPSWAQDHPLAGEVIASTPAFDESGNGWVATDPASQSVTDGMLMLESPTFGTTQFDTRLSASGLQVTADLSSAAGVVVALRSQMGARPGGYFVEVMNSGAVLLYVVDDGFETVLGESALSFDPRVVPVAICVRADGNRLRGWVWPVGEQVPQDPTVSATESEITFTQGRPRLGVREGVVGFSDLTVAGVTFRPKILDFELWRPEPRILLVLETTPGSRHRLEESVDRVVWRTRYLIDAEAEGETTTIVVPGSFQQQASLLVLNRVINDDTNEGTSSKKSDFLFPKTLRMAVTWESEESASYRFEYSLNLRNWHRIDSIHVRGEPSSRSTQTVLPLPRDVSASEPLFVRVVER